MIAVYFGKLDDRMEVLDTTNVRELRNSIKAKFPNVLAAYAPAELDCAD